MPITLKETVGQQVSAGTHVAICHRIVYLGTQPDTGFGAKPKLAISWELPHERIEVDGKEKPMGTTKIYSLGNSGGMNKKSSLRKDLSAWRGRDFTAEELKGFELKNILGKGCQVQVEHNDEGRAKVTAVVGLPRGMKTEPSFNPLVEYSIDEGKNENYLKLPDWLQQMCNSCLEWNGSNGEEAPPQDHSEHATDSDDSGTPF